MPMRSIFALATGLVLMAAALSPAWSAPTPQARAYIEARRGHAISTLTPAEAHADGGHDGAVVEWAGVLEDEPATPAPPATVPTPDAAASGSAVSSPGAPLSGSASPPPATRPKRPLPKVAWKRLRTRGGATFRVRVAGAGTWKPGKPVYLIARVVERDGVVEHLNVLALGTSADITAALQESMRKAASRVPVGPAGGYTGVGLSLNGAMRWILSFNGGMDASTAQTLARSVLQSCQAYGVDPRLALSLFAAESAFRTGAVSSAGAQGLGQLMPGTAARYGVRDPFNPFENADASIRHLGDLLRRWRATPKTVELALAAYNAGAGAVEQYGGIPPYAETVQYVKTILDYYAELSRYP